MLRCQFKYKDDMATSIVEPCSFASPPLSLRDSSVKFGVIGYGYWGPNVVRNLGQLEDADIVAVCDKSPAAQKRLQKAFPQMEVFSDPAELVASPKIDAVAVITPVWT